MGFAGSGKHKGMEVKDWWLCPQQSQSYADTRYQPPLCEKHKRRRRTWDMDKDCRRKIQKRTWVEVKEIESVVEVPGRANWAGGEMEGSPQRSAEEERIPEKDGESESGGFRVLKRNWLVLLLMFHQQKGNQNQEFCAQRLRVMLSSWHVFMTWASLKRGIGWYFFLCSISKFLENSTANSLSTDAIRQLLRPNLCCGPKLCWKILHKF